MFRKKSLPGTPRPTLKGETSEYATQGDQIYFCVLLQRVSIKVLTLWSWSGRSASCFMVSDKMAVYLQHTKGDKYLNRRLTQYLTENSQDFLGSQQKAAVICTAL